MPIAAAAAIGAAGSIASAYIGSQGAKAAADKQYQAQMASLALQKEIYGKNQANLMPWMDTGGKAAYSLADLYGLGSKGAQGTNDAFTAFTNLPAYQFPLQQGMLALTRNLNAQGKTMSGAQMRAVQDYAQGLASTYMMNNYVNPLMSMSQTGAQAAGSLAGTNATMAANMGNTLGNAGTAQAGGIVGSTQSLMGGVQGLSNSLQLYSLLGQKGGGFNFGGDTGSPTYSLAGKGGFGG